MVERTTKEPKNPAQIILIAVCLGFRGEPGEEEREARLVGATPDLSSS